MTTSIEFRWISRRWESSFGIAIVYLQGVKTEFKQIFDKDLILDVYKYLISIGMDSDTVFAIIKRSVHSGIARKAFISAFYKLQADVTMQEIFRREKIEVIVRPVIVTGYGSAGSPFRLLVYKDDKVIFDYIQYVFDGLWAQFLDSKFTRTIRSLLPRIIPQIKDEHIDDTIRRVFERASQDMKSEQTETRSIDDFLGIKKCL